MSQGIHIVFQVLNFLHSDESKKYNILPIDRLILINLASHKGPKGICPSIFTLSKELNHEIRDIRRRLKYLSSIFLVEVKEFKGRCSQYDLAKLSTGEGPQTLGCEIIPRVHRPYGVGSIDPTTPGPQTLLSTKDQLNNRERGANAPHTLSDSFQSNEEQKKYCLLNRIDIGSELVRFKLFSKAKGNKLRNWDAAFDLWLGNARKMPSLTGETTLADLEVVKRQNPPRYPEARSTVKDFKDVVYETRGTEPSSLLKEYIESKGIKFN